MTHPCLLCGACCATFRVAFHWMETDLAGGIVPSALTEHLDPHRVNMHGTNAYEPRCKSLVGEVGVAAHCGVYEVRPSPCHDLQPAWENGQPSPQCDKARVKHGMSPLTPADFGHA
jgi:Fe-S-cluster containining protein